MKIVLNTKEETLQDLKDTVHMLQALIESRSGTVVRQPDMFSATPSGDQAAVSGLMSMFGDNTSQPMLAKLEEGTNDPERSKMDLIQY